MCLVHFASHGKFTCVLVPFLVLLEILMYSYKRIVFSWKIDKFSNYIQASWKIWFVLEISLRKPLLEKKNRYFTALEGKITLYISWIQLTLNVIFVTFTDVIFILFVVAHVFALKIIVLLCILWKNWTLYIKIWQRIIMVSLLRVHCKCNLHYNKTKLIP